MTRAPTAAPHRARRALQRLGGVVHFITTARRGALARRRQVAQRRARHHARRARADRLRRRRRGRRGARREWRRTAGPAHRPRIDPERSSNRRCGSPPATRPPVSRRDLRDRQRQRHALRPTRASAPAPRARPPRRRTAACLSPITWYFSCPLPAISTTSPGCASRTARSIAASRSTTARRRRHRNRRQHLPWCIAGRSPGGTMPRLMSSMISAGSSERGLSDVSTTRSLSRAGDRAHQRTLGAIAIAAAAEHRDQPARASGRTVSSTFFSASSVCA